MKVEDLIKDVSFRNWANGTVTEDCQKWERFLDVHPEDADLLLTAKIMAGGNAFASEKPGPGEIQRAWSDTHKGIQDYNKAQSRRRWLRYAAAAACMGLVVTAGFLISFGHHETWIALNTAPGQIKEYVLDDGTKVTLNGNSRLWTPESLSRHAMREVRLEGEAFFEVTRQGEHTPFRVLMKDAQVLVLGTVFNIRSRSEHSVISLLEGKVEVTNQMNQDRVTLRPGQTAAVHEQGIEVHHTDVQSAASWRNQLWVFEETPLHEVLTNLQESFGIAVTIEQDVDTNKEISGKLSTKNLTTLYRALETMLGVTIVEKGTNIVIKNKAG